MIDSGGIEHNGGVGILGKKVANPVIGYWLIYERVLMVKLQVRPLNINHAQLFLQPRIKNDAEIEVFYEDIKNALKYTESDDDLCVMEDFDTDVGSE